MYNRGTKVFSEDDISNIQLGLHFKDNSVKAEVNASLYNNLKLYTKGDAYDVVKSNGEDRVLESFRYVVSKGKDASQAHILVVQNRAMNPEGAKTLKDIERRMAEWKKDLRYLDGVKANTIVTEQKKHIMIGMMPDTIADQMTINYKKEETYGVIEQDMVDLVDRMLQREKKSTKKILETSRRNLKRAFLPSRRITLGTILRTMDMEDIFLVP